MRRMTPCHVVQIQTPKKYLLNGFWFGPKRPKRVIIWVHGLGSSAFNKLENVKQLTDKQTAVLIFNNRGHDRMSRLVRLPALRRGEFGFGGEASEVFTDCIDDIQGAINFSKKSGTKDIFLTGHSTGSQKCAYWAYKQKGRGVRGIILQVPLSDYADAIARYGSAKLKKATNAARALVARGKKHEMITPGVWSTPYDAQRFLSLFTPDSVEQSIFSYFDSRRKSVVYSAIRTPLLVILAERDEFADRPAREIANWFEKYNKSRRFKAIIVPKTGHSFKGKEKVVAREVRKFIQRR